MHKEISMFPSKQFYQSRLKDANSVLGENRLAPWHADNLYQPFTFFDAHRGSERSGIGKSLYNEEEILIVVGLVQNLAFNFPNIHFARKIGIIAFYKEQVEQLKRRFVSVFGRGITNHIDINTVDGFQGQEKDIIILSCVRSSPDGRKANIGFLSDRRRLVF
jgi:senataxin